MRKEPIHLEPPEKVWLTYTPGQYHMQNTTWKDPSAVEYVRADICKETLEYCERMTGYNLLDPVSVLVELRFALGDKGTRSIPQLLEYARTLGEMAKGANDGLSGPSERSS